MTHSDDTSRPQAVRTLARQPAPPGIYASKYTAELAASLCQRVAEGESLRSICRADPSMPTEKTVWNWARSHPDFAECWAVARHLARRRAMAAHAEREAARQAKWAADEAAVKAGPAQGRVLYAGGPGSWGRPAWNRGLSGYRPDIAEAICDRLCLGETLQSVCRDPEMPSVGTVYNWLRAHPEFVDLYRRAKEIAFAYIVETAAEQAPWLETEARSMRELRRIVRAAHRRCAQIAPKAFADGVCGPEDR
ncbi:hypothetical protein [Phenylobacterium sp.]|uniref:terminase small subunit-like protein n=1 Tax=Phenylobacterium sp. TaxID=1871053 RepID=UPI003BA973A3